MRCKHCNKNLSHLDEDDYHRCSAKGGQEFLVSAVIGYFTDSALLGGLLGGSILGGIIGDVVDGDLFD